MIPSCFRIKSVAVVSEMLGSVTGIHIAVSSSSGGMNSEPIVVARYTEKAKQRSRSARVSRRWRNAKRSAGA